MEEWQQVLAQMLKEELRETGLSQRKLASKIGVSHVQLGRWLEGQDQPSMDSQIKLAAYFSLPETPFSQLIRGEIGERELRVAQITERFRALSADELKGLDRVLQATLRMWGIDIEQEHGERA